MNSQSSTIMATLMIVVRFQAASPQVARASSPNPAQRRDKNVCERVVLCCGFS